LRQASLRDAVANYVHEQEFDKVPAQGRPQGKGRYREERLEIMPYEREHCGHRCSNRHVSRQRAVKRLFYSRRITVRCSAIVRRKIRLLTVHTKNKNRRVLAEIVAMESSREVPPSFQ